MAMDDATFKVFVDRLTITGDYVAPSWSWASGRGGVSFNCPESDENRRKATHWRQECLHIEPRVTLKGADPYGQLKHASLVIESRIRPLAQYRHKLGSWGNPGYVGSEEEPVAKVHVDWAAHTDGPPEDLQMLLLGSAELDEACPGAASQPQPWGDRDGVQVRRQRLAYGLLVWPVPGTDVFLRVGIVHSIPNRHGGGLSFFEGWGERTVTLI
ncbi:Uu.00g145910.m01.CDS01 [Anthostomella pinea]|uniref:Uu.00g145910.m01.CDS01 n=1 Tax=Anthostomella pinea TaxID=933095 RepID=A0AAI8VKM7_9PEZI|nr:Uu.00g145910.m01.CDS01 [Anthostomella pinea]